MALIPMEPEPGPHSYRFIAIYLLCVLLSMLIGGGCALLQAGGQ